MLKITRIDDGIFIEFGYRKEEIDLAVKKYGLEKEGVASMPLRGMPIGQSSITSAQVDNTKYPILSGI